MAQPPRAIPGLTGNDLMARLAAGPEVTFTTAQSMLGPVVQCKWGTVLLGNGATQAEAAEQAVRSINDMARKLRAAGFPVTIDG